MIQLVLWGKIKISPELLPFHFFVKPLFPSLKHRFASKTEWLLLPWPLSSLQRST